MCVNLFLSNLKQTLITQTILMSRYVFIFLRISHRVCVQYNIHTMTKDYDTKNNFTNANL